MSSFISSMTYCSLSNELFSFQLFICCFSLLLLLSSSFIALWSDSMHGIISIFLICWGLLCALGYDLFWRRFHGLLRRMYIVSKFDEMFCRHQVSIWSVVYLRSWISLFIFCLDDLSIDDNGVLKCPTTTVLVFIYAFRSFRVCLMKLSALTLGAFGLFSLLLVWNVLFISFDQHRFEVYFFRDKYCYFCLFSGPLGF
jgi:hypothetical protein